MTILSRKALLLYELSEREPGWRFTARCHTKTVAKRARVEPRTQMHVTMKMLIWVVITNEKVFVNFGICFRSWIEALDRANKIKKWQCQGKVLLAWSFSKVGNFGRVFEQIEKLKFLENCSEGVAPALRVIRAGTWLTVHRSLPVPKQ